MRVSRMLGLTLTVLLVVPSVALGGFPVGGAVLVSYGAGYPGSDGCTVVHHGADVACAAGDTVSSPIDGEVTFVGRVPAAGGGTMLAMSVRAGDDVVSLMPLESASLARGAGVRRGDEVGVVAESGDSSCDATHLHVSLRRNGVYIDPSPLLVAALDVPTESQPPQSDSPPGETDRITEGPGPVRGASQSGTLRSTAAFPPAELTDDAHDRVPEGEGSAVNVAASPIARDAVDAPAVATEIAPGVSLPASNADRPLFPERLLGASSADPQSLSRLLRRAASPVGTAAAVAAVLAVALILSRRAVERRIQSNPPVSDRFGSMLQHLRAGDTLCGLTSCPGLLPSQSRGRLAQRR